MFGILYSEHWITKTRKSCNFAITGVTSRKCLRCLKSWHSLKAQWVKLETKISQPYLLLHANNITVQTLLQQYESEQLQQHIVLIYTIDYIYQNNYLLCPPLTVTHLSRLSTITKKKNNSSKIQDMYNTAFTPICRLFQPGYHIGTAVENYIKS